MVVGLSEMRPNSLYVGSDAADDSASYLHLRDAYSEKHQTPATAAMTSARNDRTAFSSAPGASPGFEKTRVFLKKPTGSGFFRLFRVFFGFFRVLLGFFKNDEF